ncbi:hypothetical protein chiPu_0019386 [Chiloscyllium punctatum]|uniref:Uncharacterized protein n=1 Tax=Chiloscyllium punctatum TaxID=137246 RepID=A0A401RRR7_CHIPU|nr:hypothetical protein [Chiloscyllium punctatum]
MSRIAPFWYHGCWAKCFTAEVPWTAEGETFNYLRISNGFTSAVLEPYYVRRKSQRTFKKLIESPTQIPYFLCILIYWGLLLVAPVLPKGLYIPWVLHCSLDQLVVLFSWPPGGYCDSVSGADLMGEPSLCVRCVHPADRRRTHRREQTLLSELVEDFEWKQQLEDDCLNIKQMTETEMMLYSIESPHVLHSYTGIEEGAERLIRVRKAVILLELREKLAKQMAKIQVSTNCALANSHDLKSFTK